MQEDVVYETRSGLRGIVEELRRIEDPIEDPNGTPSHLPHARALNDKLSTVVSCLTDMSRIVKAAKGSPGSVPAVISTDLFSVGMAYRLLDQSNRTANRGTLGIAAHAS